ncbi:MAG TPA: MFS transporter [Nitrosopumilaceae archaeon]|nr:MFS transporter [Nitrosopumilaceae archaeon]
MSSAKNSKWIWYLFPSNIVSQGLSTVIPLYVIFLGGNIGEIAIIVAMQNGASAFGSIFWGKVIDRFHVRRAVLLVSFFVVMLCSLLMYFTNSINVLYVISPLLGFFIVGKNPVAQLLVMESIHKNQWRWLFARTSIIATFGMFGAMIIGAIGSVYFDLKPYFLICAAACVATMGLSMTIKESQFHLERSSIAHSIHGLRYVFSNFHVDLPRIPEIYDYKHIITIFKGRVTDEIGIFYITNFLFYLGSNIYFTSFTPFLKNYGYSNSDVFLIYVIQTAAMISVFFLAPRFISKMGEERSISLSYVPRIAAVVIAGLFIPITVGQGSFAVAIISASLMVIAFSIFSTATSIIFFKSIPPGFEGKYLGVNSSITTVGLFIGALCTGQLANSFGYTITYAVASGILVVSFALFRVYLRYRLSEKTD